jgi:single-strand DNA-binding protein
MQELISLQGLVATTPRTVTTKEGIQLTSFRLVSAARRFNREIAQWEDSNTNWYTVVGFRRIAENMAASLEKGQRVVLQGRLRVKDWDNGEKTGTTVEIEVLGIGHDLSWGTSVFERTVYQPSEPEELTAAVS